VRLFRLDCRLLGKRLTSGFVDEDQLGGNQVGGVVGLAIALPLARLQPAMSLDQRALGDARLGNLGLATPAGDPEPVALLDWPAIRRLPALRDAQVELGEHSAIGNLLDLSIPTDEPAQCEAIVAAIGCSSLCYRAT
jgi:hypothetical protein